MDKVMIGTLILVAYSGFIGYCLGRAVGYSKGADMAVKIYCK